MAKKNPLTTDAERSRASIARTAKRCIEIALSVEDQQDRDNGAANTGGAKAVADAIRAKFGLR